MVIFLHAFLLVPLSHKVSKVVLLIPSTEHQQQWPENPMNNGDTQNGQELHDS